MLDFPEIKNKYLLAYEKLCDKYYLCFNHITGELEDQLSDEVFYNRNLYDFFDEQGIIISVGYDFETKEYYFDIYNEINCLYASYEIRYNTRQQAEDKAFIKAFEILNERLKNEHNGRN